MGRKPPADFTEVISIKVVPKQRVWLENKAIEMTQKLGRDVMITHVLRAMIWQQMDLDEEAGKVWDEPPISCAV